MIELIISNLISAIFSSAVERLFVKREKSNYFDYVLEDINGEKIAIEVIPNELSERKIEQLYDFFLKHKSDINKFYVVTQSKPEDRLLNQFKNLFKADKLNAKLIEVNELKDLFGLEDIGDLNDPKNLDKLQTKSLISDFKLYAKPNVPLGLIESPQDFFKQFKQNKEILSQEYKVLTRQFPKNKVVDFFFDERNINEIFRVGERSQSVTIVLTDIKNFSSLVKASNPDNLNEIMRKYYSKSKELVFANNGMLDKFIGDAVLAVFGFPTPDENSIKNAINFSQELINLGNSLFPELLFDINEFIETGTRVGMATGDVWSLNIGDEFPEITLVGDTINLAARLEKNSEVNGILLNNKTRAKILRLDPNYVETLGLTEKIIEPAEAKGQFLPIRAWQIN